MKIIKLEAENFKRLNAISIAPDGSTVVIGGRNGQGKSSALDAIEAVLGGARHTPKEPIKNGTKKARICLETDELIVTRTFNAKGQQLEVKGKDGSTLTSPQALLDTLVGPISFDPLAFSRQDPKEQAATLRRLVGLDFTKEDVEKQKKYEERTVFGRELKRLNGALYKMPEAPIGTPNAEVSVAELVAEAERRQKINIDHDTKRGQLASLREKAAREVVAIEQRRKAVEAAAAELASLERELVVAQADLENTRTKGVALRAEVDALVDADVAEITKHLATAEQTNAAVRAKQERAKLEAELDAMVEESEKLTEYIRQIDSVKADAAAKASYPIPGLAITDVGVTLDGVPFEQASQAQKLRVSVAIGLALNPKLKVLLIRDASVLDDESLALVAKAAADADAQVWLERVGKGSEVHVVIEDGSIEETRPAASAEAAAS